MRTIDGKTLALAIQSVDFKISALEKSLDELPEDQGAELESLLLAYENAAQVLKQAYQEACIETGNLPAYDRLLGDADGR